MSRFFSTRIIKIDVKDYNLDQSLTFLAIYQGGIGTKKIVKSRNKSMCALELVDVKKKGPRVAAKNKSFLSGLSPP